MEEEGAGRGFWLAAVAPGQNNLHRRLYNTQPQNINSITPLPEYSVHLQVYAEIRVETAPNLDKRQKWRHLF